MVRVGIIPGHNADVKHNHAHFKTKVMQSKGWLSAIVGMLVI